MEFAYHQLIPLLVLDQLPELKRFFDANGFTEGMIRAAAVRPDVCYHDSMMQTAELHHAHSIKLYRAPTGSLRWRDGDCIDSIKTYAGMIVRMYLSKDFALVCRFLAELSHYLVDGMTFPHLVRGKPWSDYHMQFEIAQARWLKDLVRNTPVADGSSQGCPANHWPLGPLKFAPEKSVFRSALARAKALYPEAQQVIAALQAGFEMSDEENLEYARKIATAVGSVWVTITNSLFPKE